MCSVLLIGPVLEDMRVTLKRVLVYQVVFNFIGIKDTQGGIATSCEFTGFHVQIKDSKKKVK
jgi:hypothetical protein